MPTELRPAADEDLGAIAEILLASRAAAQMPPLARPAEDVRRRVAAWDLGAYDVWVAERGGRRVGFARATATWLDDLHVTPAEQGAGVGTALLDRVKAERPDGFGLWVFEMNAPARAFYAARGLIELETTDGTANEEGAPDVRLVWPGADQLGCLRAMIDEVDLLLGDVLARRVALTRAVQAVKPSTARDPAREELIARRVAAIASELGPERVARIVEAIITESLDATVGRAPSAVDRGGRG